MQTKPKFKLKNKIELSICVQKQFPKQALELKNTRLSSLVCYKY